MADHNQQGMTASRTVQPPSCFGRLWGQTFPYPSVTYILLVFYLLLVTVSGKGFAVEGVRRILHEMVYNLCDHAIKYNCIGGSVTILPEDRRLTVRETGIGIPAEYRDRVFERFYRGDKRHSRASGGTGLGLSTVKHAAAYHKAEIRLDSTPGERTAITISF